MSKKYYKKSRKPMSDARRLALSQAVHERLEKHYSGKEDFDSLVKYNYHGLVRKHQEGYKILPESRKKELFGHMTEYIKEYFRNKK